MTATTRKPEVAVLLAAGLGARLAPYTESIPKCLLPVHGRPIMAYILESIHNAGITKVIVVTHHLEHRITSYLGSYHVFPITFSLSHQTRLDGTAHALAGTQDNFDNFMTSSAPLLICATDYLLPDSYVSDLVRFHQTHECPITLSLREVSNKRARSSSIVRFGSDGNIAEIIEKPTVVPNSIHPLAASLIYLTTPDIYSYAARTPISVRGERELPETINIMISNGFCARGCVQPALPELDASLLGSSLPSR